MSLTCEHRAFIVEGVLKNGKSYTAALRIFKNYYELSRNDHMPTRKSVIMWVKMFSGVRTLRGLPGVFRFRSTESALKLLTHIIADFRVGT